MKKIFVCEDNLENILTGIFMAFEYRKSTKNTDIDIVIDDNGTYNIELFADYENVETDMNKVSKTALFIKKKYGGLIYDYIIKALCHFNLRRGYIIYKYMEYLLLGGTYKTDDLTNEFVMRTLELSRKSHNESHLYLGIIRFSDIHGILYAKIEPKCHVIPLIIEHFSDRFPGENWVIEDVTRNMMAVHKALGETIIIMGSFEEMLGDEYSLNKYDKYEDLWKTFFNSIAIKQRNNPRCQRTLLPLWMRKHMPEFI